MASSPLAKETKDQKHARLNLRDKVFGEKIKLLVRQHNVLMKLSQKVSSLPAGDHLIFRPDTESARAVGRRNVDTPLGRKDVNSLSKQYTTELKGLKANYVEHGKKKKRASTGNSAGFKNPILVTPNMIEFFRSANLGPSQVGPNADPNAPPLNDFLSVRDDGKTTRAILTPLFSIYAHVNNMQRDPENRQFLTSTPDMDAHFQETYRILAARPQTYQKRKVVGPDGVETKVEDRTKPIPIFRPDHFRYASIQSIVALNTIKKGQLTAAQKQVLGAPDMPAGLDEAQKAQWVAQRDLARAPIVNRLAQEQDMVSGILEVYRGQKAAAAKAAKTASK